MENLKTLIVAILSSHLSKLAAASIITFCTFGGTTLDAQEIIMPERWSKSISEVEPLFASDTLTILVAGDMMMHTAQLQNARRSDLEYDFSSYFHLIEDEIAQADIAIANMEFTLAGEPHTGYPCFSAPDSYAHYLADCGFDIFLTANNHIFDKGGKGAERTLEIYRNMEGIRFTGLASDEQERAETNPLFVLKKGIRTALINFTYGTNMGSGTHWPKVNYMANKVFLEEAFAKAYDEDADLTIALPHWGDEYILKHNESQEEMAGWMARNGADFIIGSHPHVIQDTQTTGSANVAYSLGNAVSNMSAANTQLGLLAKISVVRLHNGDLKQLPLEFTYIWCSRPGGYNCSYTVIPVKRFIGQRDIWIGTHDYDKMIETYNRVKEKTGIND